MNSAMILKAKLAGPMRKIEKWRKDYRAGKRPVERPLSRKTLLCIAIIESGEREMRRELRRAA